MGLFPETLDEKAVLSLVHILTLLYYSEHGFVHLEIISSSSLKVFKKTFPHLELNDGCVGGVSLLAVPVLGFQWRTVEDKDRGSSERQEPRLPALPGLVVVDDALRHPGHEGDLLVAGEGSVEFSRVVSVLQADVVSDELGHLGEEGGVLVVDDPGAAAVHPPHLESCGSELVCPEDISGERRVVISLIFLARLLY